MSDRPELCKDMDSTVFRDYYYLKEEMVAFCRENGLPVSGGKLELTERIAHFLDTGEVLPTQPRLTRAKTDTHLEITLSAVIEENFVCSEKHRAFFKSEIGSSFSFNVEFQKWLKNNAGKTYADAIAAYHQIMEQKKTAKTTIGKQFEYNTYIRAFFEDNPGKNIADAIKCWKYKKSRKGHNQYERADLISLEK